MVDTGDPSSEKTGSYSGDMRRRGRRESPPEDLGQGDPCDKRSRPQDVPKPWPEPEGAIFPKRSVPQEDYSTPHDAGASMPNWLETNIQGGLSWAALLDALWNAHGRHGSGEIRDHAGRWRGQADRGWLRYYNRVMPRRPHYQRGIKRGQICDWPDGVGTPDEVAARVTYTGNRIHKTYMSSAGPPAWPRTSRSAISTMRSIGPGCCARSGEQYVPAASAISAAHFQCELGFGSMGSCTKPV